MRSSTRSRAILALATICVTVSLTEVGRATSQSQRDMAKEKALWDELQPISPSAVELFKTATSRLDEGDYQGAATMFSKVLYDAPGFEPAERRLGMALVLSGKSREGRAMLEELVSKDRSPENLGTLADALLQPNFGFAPSLADQARALTLVQEADRLTGGEDDYGITVARLALDLRDYDQFRRAADSLALTHRDLMQTHFYKGIEAGMDGNWQKAEQEIRRAEALGLPREVGEKALTDRVPSPTSVTPPMGFKAYIWKWFTGWSFQADDLWYVFGFWVLGLVLLSVIGKALSGLTLRSVEEDDPNDFKSKRHVTLRKFYRLVINIAAVYYYLSVPVVICLLLAAAGAITYGFFMLGHVPLRLVVIVIVGALVTAGLMIRSLFVRGKSTDPGRAIRFQEAPGLWKLTREVSSAVGTQPVDEIRLTPGTDLAVYENRSSRGRKGGRAKRVLLLGAGVLNGFSLNAFRAVLAHEYGHLSHRDTAGGEVALRVNANMTSFAVAIVASGQAVWWNLGFWFLRVYHFIFRRLSHGATRLQEVLADRVAVVNYGARAFEEGLRHVVRRSVEFEEAAHSEIVSANQGRRALRNLYDLESVESIHLQNKVSAAISRPTTEDDTHPSPVDRFRYASRIISKRVRPLEGTVWDLFVDREGITNELSNTISERIRAARG